MKGNFDGQSARLTEILQRHDPYVVLAVSTTGLDDRNFNNHQAVAVCVQEFVYSEKDKRYIEGITLNEQIKCAPEALQYAIDSADNGGYNIFSGSGIDRESYIRGENVMDIDTFKQRLTQMFEGMTPDTVYIANGAEHCLKYLDKIGCADFLKIQNESHNLLDQPALSKHYFKEHSVDCKKATLEAISTYINNANEYMRSENIEKFSDVNQAAFNVYHEQRTENKGKKLTSGMDKARLINQFVQFRGRELEFLPQTSEAEISELENELTQSWTQSGKNKYRNADFEEKFDKLIKSGVLSPEMANRDYNCDLNTFYNIIEGKTSVKSAVFFQIATTGFSAGNEPIQFTAFCADFENGKFTNLRDKLTFNIAASNRNVQIALDLANKGEFDTFKDANIDKNEYLEGKRMSIDEAVSKIGEFFRNHNSNEYVYISNGKANKTDKSFSAVHLGNIGNFGLDKKEVLDVAEIIKQYCYVCHYDDQYETNAILNENEWKGRNFSLKDFADARGEEINGTQAKVILMGDILTQIGEQHYERIFGKLSEKEKAAVSEDKKEINMTPVPEQVKDELTEEEKHNLLKPQTKAEKPYIAIIYIAKTDEIIMVGEKGKTYDSQESDKMRFSTASEARQSIYRALEDNLGTTDLGRNGGWALYNENEVIIETRGTFPLEKVFDKAALEVNGLLNQSRKASEQLVREETESIADESGYKNVSEAVSNVPRERERRRYPLVSRETSNGRENVEPPHRPETRLFSENAEDSERKIFRSDRPARPTAPTRDGKTVIINAFGGAGAGKTQACMNIATNLKNRGYTVEYVPEYVKELLYDNPRILDGSIENQRRILMEQERRLNRYIGKVDFVITDAPLLLNSVYLNDCPEKKEYSAIVAEKFKSYNNFCFIVNRETNSYQQAGRIQSLDEAKAYDQKIINALNENNFIYSEYSDGAADKIVENALRVYARVNPERGNDIRKEIAKYNSNSMMSAANTANKSETASLVNTITEMTAAVKDTINTFSEKTNSLIASIMEQNKLFSQQLQMVIQKNIELTQTNQELSSILAESGYIKSAAHEPQEKKQTKAEKNNK